MRPFLRPVRQAGQEQSDQPGQLGHDEFDPESDWNPGCSHSQRDLAGVVAAFARLVHIKLLLQAHPPPGLHEPHHPDKDPAQADCHGDQ
jgi:hypothetical protein